MQISLERLLRGHYFHAGLRTAGGLLAVVAGAYCAGGLPTAATAAAGAVCAGAVDMPSPFRHKRREMPVAWLLSSAVYWFVGGLHTVPGLLGPGIVLLSFLIALGASYGNKAIMVGFSGNFAIIMALGAQHYTEHNLLTQVGWFAAGGAAYVVYGLATAKFQVFRTKQQVFAESAFELARYMRLRAAFYEEGANLEALYSDLVRRQAMLVQKQQTTREFLFRDIKSDRDLRLAQLFIMQVDLFEYVIAGNTDYEILQKHHSGSDMMLFLRDLVHKIAKDIDNVAFTALRNAQARKTVKYKAELFAVEYDLERLSHDGSQDIDALSVLIDAVDKIILCTEKVTDIHRVQDAADYVPDGTVSVKLSLFTAGSNYSPRVLLRNLTLRSLYFRYALRVGTATACGLLIAWGLSSFIPGAFSHSYWILMTIFVVLRPNFSLTVQRRTDRIIGSLCGSLLAATLLYLAPPVPLLALCLFAAQVVIVTFLMLNYRWASAAASVLTLIQIHFLNPSATFAFGERVGDTILGALLAYVCCYIFPSWEYRSIPQLIKVLSGAEARYTRAVLDSGIPDEEYRLARKIRLDAMAELAGAFDRMLREPRDKHRAVNETGRFLTLNHLYGSRLASVRTLLARLAVRPAEAAALPRLGEVQEKAGRLFALAEEAAGLPGGAAARTFSQSGHEAEKPDTAEIDAAVLKRMDYSEQNVVMLLLKQLDSALILAGEIQALRRDFGLAHT